MSYKEIDMVDDLIKKKKKEIVSYSSDEKGLTPRIEKGAEWDRAKDELNMLDKILSVLTAHEHMVEKNKMDFGYVISKLTSGTARIYYRIGEVSRNVVHFTIKDELDSEEVIAELNLTFADSECYLGVTKAPERGISKKAIEVMQSKKTAYTVYNRGIFITGKYYYSDDFANLLGRNVLVTDPVDGSVEVFSTEGKHLTTAFVKDSDKKINSVNLKVTISTSEDIERLRKLCDELRLSLSSQEATSEKQGTYPDDSFLSLSGKELKELVNEWIVYHMENDINLSPGYFERLLRGWETIYRRQCGMSMLDTF